MSFQEAARSTMAARSQILRPTSRIRSAAAARPLINFLILVCLLAATFCLALSPSSVGIAARSYYRQQAITQNSGPQSQTIFSNLLAPLQQKTRVPIKLPHYVPYSDDQENRLYAILEIAQSDRYSIQLAWLKDCEGGNACHVGYIGGSKAPFPLTGKHAVAVELTDNIVGTFENPDCGAHCDDASLDWRQGGYYYGISLKAGDKQTLVRMANSAIRPTERRNLGNPGTGTCEKIEFRLLAVKENAWAL